MKKSRITIEINAEKLKAIKIYEKNTETTLNKTLNDTILEYYKVVVPQEVQFYLESQRIEAENKRKNQQNKKLAK